MKSSCRGSMGSREPGSVESMKETSAFALLLCFCPVLTINAESGIQWTGQVTHSSHITAAFWNQQTDGPMGSRAVRKSFPDCISLTVSGCKKGPH